jgi:hypothetical protein
MWGHFQKKHTVQLDSPVYIDLLSYWVLLCLKETPLAWSLDDDDDDDDEEEEEFRLHQRDLFQPIIELSAFYASCLVFFTVMSQVQKISIMFPIKYKKE